MTQSSGYKIPRGGAESMGAFLRREGWHELQPTGFTKAERTNLMHILARLDEVQAYRTRFAQTKGEQKLQRHNNPSSVWRAFLKDIGEKKPKGGDGKSPGKSAGKKSTLKEAVAELQERVDGLTKENAGLTAAIAGGEWETQITAIVENVDPDKVAETVFALPDTTDAIGLTEALVAEYCKMGNILEVVDLDPKEVIRHNSPKARKLADDILNELDGQTDEPHDERLAKRIINGRGVAAARLLAIAIMAEIGSQIQSAPLGPTEQPPKEPVEPSHASVQSAESDPLRGSARRSRRRRLKHPQSRRNAAPNRNRNSMNLADRSGLRSAIVISQGSTTLEVAAMPKRLRRYGGWVNTLSKLATSGSAVSGFPTSRSLPGPLLSPISLIKMVWKPKPMNRL